MLPAVPRYIPEVSSGRGVAYCMCVGTLGLGSVHTPIVTVTVGVTPRVVQSSLVQLVMEVVVEENDNEEDENGVKTEKQVLLDDKTVSVLDVQRGAG